MSTNDNEKLYTTLEKESESEFEEKRSIFIGSAAPVKNEDEALAFIRKIKNKYPDATHNVWAFVLEGGYVQRYSDDGEPQGTAGMPVLDTIRKSGCSDAAIVVTRYFGGTLLGAGGLIRAYSHSASLALEASHIITYENYDVLRLVCNYSEYQKYSAELEKTDAVIDGTDFSEFVTIRFAMNKKEYPRFAEKIREMSAGKTECEKIGERYEYKRP